MRRRSFLQFASAAAVPWPLEAFGQAWPSKPLTMVVPYTAGSSTDVVARILSPSLSELLGQPVIIDNISGAGGMIGSARVATSAPDYHRFVLGNVGTHAQNQTLYKKPLYNSATDFAPVALIGTLSFVLVTRFDFPANNLQEFIAYAKANEAKMQYGSAGAGSGIHLACVLLNAAIGVDVTHVPYRGVAYVQDLMAGRLDYACTIDGNVVAQIEGKTIKALAVLGERRSTVLPDVATAREQGLGDFDVSSWMAIFLPKGTPGEIVRKLHDATVATMNTPAVQKRMKEFGVGSISPERQSSEYLATFVRSEIEKWSPPIKASGVSMD